MLVKDQSSVLIISVDKDGKTVYTKERASGGKFGDFTLEENDIIDNHSTDVKSPKSSIEAEDENGKKYVGAAGGKEGFSKGSKTYDNNPLCI